jgi:hypothetical protein
MHAGKGTSVDAVMELVSELEQPCKQLEERYAALKAEVNKLEAASRCGSKKKTDSIMIALQQKRDELSVLASEKMSTDHMKRGAELSEAEAAQEVLKKPLRYSPPLQVPKKVATNKGATGPADTGDEVAIETAFKNGGVSTAATLAQKTFNQQAVKEFRLGSFEATRTKFEKEIADLGTMSDLWQQLRNPKLTAAQEYSLSLFTDIINRKKEELLKIKRERAAGAFQRPFTKVPEMATCGTLSADKFGLGRHHTWAPHLIFPGVRIPCPYGHTFTSNVTITSWTDARRVCGIFIDEWISSPRMACDECKKNPARVELANRHAAAPAGSAERKGLAAELQAWPYQFLCYEPEVTRLLFIEYPWLAAQCPAVIINDSLAVTHDLADFARRFCALESNPHSLAKALREFKAQRFLQQQQQYYGYALYRRAVVEDENRKARAKGDIAAASHCSCWCCGVRG